MRPCIRWMCAAAVAMVGGCQRDGDGGDGSSHDSSTSDSAGSDATVTEASVSGETVSETVSGETVSETVSGETVSDSATPDAAPDTTPLAASGERTMPECSGLGSGDEGCYYRFALDPATCAGRGCAKLVIFFAGGEQACVNYDNILNPYRDAGYVVACAQLFEDAKPTGSYPYHEDAARVDAVLRGIVADPTIQAAWSGEHLLIAGVSHGATSPVLAMARADYDEAPAWKGSVTTGACFFDGMYDAAALDAFTATGHAGAECPILGSIISHSRAVGRYYPTPPLAHSCNNQKCACADGHSPDIELDSVVDTAQGTLTVPASAFAIHDWKLIECGSALDPCTQDVLPAPPIAAFCNALDADADHRCTFASVPDKSHLQCAITNGAECRTWFDALVSAPR